MEWVSSKELMAAMGAMLAPCSPEAQRVCKRAYAGLLKAKAKRYCIDTSCQDEFDVPAKFWWASGMEALEQDWESGDFSTWIPPGRGQTQLRAFGVEWSRQDAEAMGVDFGSAEFHDGLADMRVELSDLAEVDRVVGENWAEKPFLRWLDAAVWIGARDPDASAALAGYRALIDRDTRRDSFGAGAIALVATATIGGDTLREGERLLTLALQSGDVRASGSRSPSGSMEPIDRLEWARPCRVQHHDGSNCLTGPKLPWPIQFYNLVIDATTVFQRWPIPGALPAAPLIESAPLPKVSRQEMREWLIERIKGGTTKAKIDATFRSAFPGKRVEMNRDAVREMYDDEYPHITGCAVKPGKRA